MSILRTGSNKKFADGWQKAYGKKRKKGASASTRAATAKKKQKK